MRTLFLSMILAATILGCSVAAELGKRAVEPSPTSVGLDGKPPIQVLAEEGPDVAANPADVGSWLEIAKALGYILVGAGGKAGVDKIRKKPA